MGFFQEDHLVPEPRGRRRLEGELARRLIERGRDGDDDEPIGDDDDVMLTRKSLSHQESNGPKFQLLADRTRRKWRKFFQRNIPLSTLQASREAEENMYSGRIVEGLFFLLLLLL